MPKRSLTQTLWHSIQRNYPFVLLAFLFILAVAAASWYFGSGVFSFAG